MRLRLDAMQMLSCPLKEGTQQAESWEPNGFMTGKKWFFPSAPTVKEHFLRAIVSIADELFLKDEQV